jgi:hypothetical protein
LAALGVLQLLNKFDIGLEQIEISCKRLLKRQHFVILVGRTINNAFIVRPRLHIIKWNRSIIIMSQSQLIMSLLCKQTPTQLKQESNILTPSHRFKET